MPRVFVYANGTPTLVAIYHASMRYYVRVASDHLEEISVGAAPAKDEHHENCFPCVVEEISAGAALAEEKREGKQETRGI